MDKPSIVFFGRTPPPVQGESVMIERSLRALRTEFPIHHVNALLSPTHGSIGRFEVAKVFKIFAYVAQALWMRFRYGATVFYYYPAPPKRIAFYRDLIILGICRLFFPTVILHWQSSGLGGWISGRANGIEKTLAAGCYHGHAGSIVTTDFDRADALLLKPKAIEVVPNSVEDRCPDFDSDLLPARELRRKDRMRAIEAGKDAEFRILFLSLCLADKGLFCTLDAAQALSRSRPGIKVRLDICGEFYDPEERRRFDAFCASLPTGGGLEVEYHGFVEAERKDSFFRAADVFSLPTKYPGEAFPVALVEAMAFGLPIVTTRWKGIPSVLPADYPGLCREQSVEEVAEAFEAAMQWNNFAELRRRYLESFEFLRFSEKLRQKVSQLISNANQVR